MIKRLGDQKQREITKGNMNNRIHAGQNQDLGADILLVNAILRSVLYEIFNCQNLKA